MIIASTVPQTHYALLVAAAVVGVGVVPAAFAFFSRRVARIAYFVNLGSIPVYAGAFLLSGSGLENSLAYTVLCTMVTPILRWKYLKLDRRPPWEDIGHLTRVAPPPSMRPMKVDWYAPGVTPEMRMLPPDYKKFLSTYGRGVFWENIIIEVPSWIVDKEKSTPPPLIDLLHSLSESTEAPDASRLTCHGGADAREALGTANDKYVGAGWAKTGQRILWRSKGVDVNTWPIVVVGEDGFDYDAKGLTHYLSGLLRGHVGSSAFSQEWIDEMRATYQNSPERIFRPLERNWNP